MSLQIIADTGEPVVYHCTVCGWGFTGNEQREWQRHVGECARKNMDEIRAKSKQMAVFDEENWDPEVAAHMRKVGQRMLKEGRLEVKPEERAGFS